jgi:acetyl-CoA acyltransferase
MTANLKPPVRVMVAGSHVGPFGRWPERSLVELAQPELRGALADAGIGGGDVEAVFVGNAFGGLMQGQETMLGQLLIADSGIGAVPVHNIKNACSSGADAAHLAWAAVAFGQYDCVLVIGAEKMTHDDRTRAMTVLATASDRVPTDPRRSVFMDLNAQRAQRYMADFGATPTHFAMCAVKNRAHAGRNENAAVREALTVEQVLADRTVVAPLTRAMCGGIADGAAALVLVSERFAQRRGCVGPVILASAVVSGDPTGSLAESATARSGRAAFEQAGIDPAAVSLAEVHDPTAPQELLDIEDLGLAPRGGAIRMLEEGATSLGGRMPVNVSGGLTSRGHPVGATGIAQIVEIARQLQGRAGASQVEGARIGLAQMAGGLLGRDSAVAVVHLLSRR